MKVSVIRNVLEANDRLAQELKDLFAERGILALNLMSSPGAGKTSLLERTLTDLARTSSSMAVIEGDLQTDNDARRVAATGRPGRAGEHRGRLPPGRLHDRGRHRRSWTWTGLDILFIENVGNLVCPAEFNLGEDQQGERCCPSPRATTSPRSTR